MKIAMINASPKQNLNSASLILLNDFKTIFPSGNNFVDYNFSTPTIEKERLFELNSFDAIVFAFPLYFDALPSHLLSCLRQIENYGITNKDIYIYGISNCGFFEGKQNGNALDVLKNWSKKVQLKWGQGLGVGGGGAFSKIKKVPLGKGPKKDLSDAFNKLSQNIIAKKSDENIYISVNFPRFMYKLAAQTGFKEMIKSNDLKVKDLNRKL